MTFAEIAVPLPIYQIYTYKIPPSVENVIKTGCRVLVPFGKRRITGYVINLLNKCERHDLKELYDLLDTTPSLSEELLKLGNWITEYYLCPPGEALKAMLPGGINQE